MRKKRCLVVFGPTAGGKSAVADRAAETAGTRLGVHVPVIVVDSMQVYKELPVVTNQARDRPAELVGVVSVSEEWTMARHRDAVDGIVDGLGVPFILEGGTGMYLNATLLDIPVSGKVPDDVRKKAQVLARDAPNPRRAAREIELGLSGEPVRTSIWDGEPRFEVVVVYLRPEREALDRAISARTARMVRAGAGEISALLHSGVDPNPSVVASVGVRELISYARGEMSLEDARNKIEQRTRRLARRQIRWFDKLTRTLAGKAEVHLVQHPENPKFQHSMHDIIEAWI